MCVYMCVRVCVCVCVCVWVCGGGFLCVCNKREIINENVFVFVCAVLVCVW